MRKEDAKKKCYNALMELGDMFLEHSNHVHAIDCYQGASKLIPDLASPFVRQGVVKVKSCLLAEAIEAFEAALNIDSDCVEAYQRLAAVHQGLGRFELAVDIYLQCLEKDKDNLPALVGLFQSSCGTGNFDRIIDLLKQYSYRHPGDSSIMLCLAALYVRQRSFVPAKHTLLSILSQYPTHEKACEMLDEIEHYLSPDTDKGELSHAI